MKKTVGTLFYLLYLLICVEVGLRIACHFLVGTPLVDVRAIVSDPNTGWKFHPGFRGPLLTYRYASISAHGTLGAELQNPKADNLRRLVVLGGSVAFGFGAAELDSNFTSFLGRLLNTSGGRRYEVINAAMPGYSSWNGRRFVEHYLRDLQPDLLLVAFGWNDSFIAPRADSDPQQHLRRPRQIFENTILGRLVEKAVLTIGFKFNLLPAWVIGRPTDQGVPRVAVTEFHENLTAIILWCQENEVQVVFWTEPRASGTHPDVSSLKLDPYTQVLREMAAQFQVPLADVAAVFDKIEAREVFANPEEDWVHPNTPGQRVMAEVVSQAILGINW